MTEETSQKRKGEDLPVSSTKKRKTEEEAPAKMDILAEKIRKVIEENNNKRKELDFQITSQREVVCYQVHVEWVLSDLFSGGHPKWKTTVEESSVPVWERIKAWEGVKFEKTPTDFFNDKIEYKADNFGELRVLLEKVSPVAIKWASFARDTKPNRKEVKKLLQILTRIGEELESLLACTKDDSEPEMEKIEGGMVKMFEGFNEVQQEMKHFNVKVNGFCGLAQGDKYEELKGL